MSSAAASTDASPIAPTLPEGKDAKAFHRLVFVIIAVLLAVLPFTDTAIVDSGAGHAWPMLGRAHITGMTLVHLTLLHVVTPSL